MSNKNFRIAIVGGGIAGLTTAIALEKLGIKATVFEAASEIKALGAGLALAANAIQGFKRIGIDGKVISAGKQIDTFSILDEFGQAITITDNRALSARFGLNNFAIHRADLHRILLQEAHGIEIVTGKKVAGFEENDDGVTLHFQDNTFYEADFVLAADGIHSAIRRQLLPDSTVRYAGYTCWRAVIQNPGIELGGSSETWGTTGRFGIVPLLNNQIYWFLCVNAAQNDPSMRAMSITELANRFKNYHSPIPEILQATHEEQVIWNDIIDLKPIQQYAFGRVLLLGDAAHATTPNMGQGACQAIEDAAVLLDTWEKNPGQSPQEIFQSFERRRLKRTHAIVNRSWTLGKAAQWTNPLAISVRNGLFRMIPARINEQQLSEY